MQVEEATEEIREHVFQVKVYGQFPRESHRYPVGSRGILLFFQFLANAPSTVHQPSVPAKIKKERSVTQWHILSDDVRDMYGSICIDII